MNAVSPGTIACWGNYEGPHTHDVPLTMIMPLLLRSRPAGLLIEGANPRHEHEWDIWRTCALPDDKVLIPGVIDTSTNYVEHPELVAQRIGRFANLLGRGPGVDRRQLAPRGRPLRRSGSTPPVAGTIPPVGYRRGELQLFHRRGSHARVTLPSSAWQC